MKTRKPRKRAIKGLLDIVGKGWKVSMDEAWKVETASDKHENKIWYEIINLRGGGHLRLKDLDKELLTVWTPRYKWANAMAEEHPEITLSPMDKEADLIFPFHMAKLVLEEGKGQKRRSLSPEHAQACADRLAAFRAAKKT